MNLDQSLIIAGLGLIILIGLLSFFKNRLMLLFVNRGIAMVQKVALKGILSVNDGKEPSWVLVEYPSQDRFRLGLLSQNDDKKGTIYLPSGPKLVPGQLIFLSNDKWHQLNLTFDEGLRIMITMGLTDDSKQISEEIWKRMEEK